MKYSLLILAIFLQQTAATAQQEQPFRLQGVIKGMPEGRLYLSYATGNNKSRTDSAVVQNGRFAFSGVLTGPVAAALYTERVMFLSSTSDYCNIFLEPGNMTITVEKGRFREARLQGSAAQRELDRWSAARAPLMKEMQALTLAYEQSGDRYRAAKAAGKGEALLAAMKDSLDEIKEKLEPYNKALEQADYAFISSHPGSYVAAYLLSIMVSRMPLAQGEAMFNKMPPALQQSIYGQAVKKELEGLRRGSPGSRAQTFSKTDINGQPLRLEDFRGKYVLLDFWASWCSPCRKGNPHLKTLYAKYNSRGLEIIGIASDDKDPEAWREAVEKDGIGIWKHVLTAPDMQKRRAGLPNPEDISEGYGIHSLPTKILINRQGMIIGRYGGGGEDDAAMDRKLSEIFGG